MSYWDYLNSRFKIHLGFKIHLVGFFTCLIAVVAAFPAGAQKKPIWAFQCSDKNKAATCYIEQQLWVQKKIDGENKTIGRLIHAIIHKTTIKNRKSPYAMQLWLPLGTNLNAGAKVFVDKSSETDLKFRQCTQQGCLTVFLPPQNFINTMKRGKNLRVAFLPYGGKQTMIAEIGLSGFTRQLKKLK